MVPYQPLRLNVSGENYDAIEIMLCEDCGAMVHDTQTHNEFHDRLDTIGQTAATAFGQADRAMGFHTPLGH